MRTLLLLLAGVGSSAAQDEGVELLHLANEGFLVRSADQAVLIDAYVAEPYVGYAALSADLRERLLAAQPPFDRVDLSLVSHVHADHFQAGFAARCLRAAPETAFVSSTQVVSALVGTGFDPARALAIVPAATELATSEAGGVRVEVFRVSHGMDGITNLAHLFEVGGVTFLHLGDGEPDPDAFEPFDLPARGVDVALVPHWYLSPAGERLIAEHIAPRHVVAMHVAPPKMAPLRKRLAEEGSTVLVLAPGESHRFEAPVSDLSPALAGLVAKHEVPGLACALLQGGRVTATGAAGLRQRGQDEPVTTGDLWHLGSCTKAMTATLIQRLVEREVLAWDLTLAEAFPGIEVHEDLRAVTLEDLCAHRSGLMRDPTLGHLYAQLYAHQGPAPAARALVARELLPLAPAHPVRGRTNYSNTGYVVVGAAIERITGSSWEDLIAREVFAPLGMTSAGFGAPGLTGELTQPRGHRQGGPGLDPAATGADNPPALGPAGTVHATLADWARFVQLHLEDESLRWLHTPRDRAGSYALGWVVLRRDWAGGRVLRHSGSNGFWLCTVWASPRKNLALMAVCNQGGPQAQAACDDACVAMLRHLGLVE